MAKLFISHSSQDDAFVRELRWTLADLKQDAWIDSRELRGGDPLWTEIQQAIEDAAAFAVVVSPDGLQSKWVGDELAHALKVRKQRGRQYPVIPLSLNGTKLGVLEVIFGEEPAYIPVSSAAGGIEAALNPILVALGQRLPADVPPTPQPQAEPLEELVLELTDLKFHEQDGVRRASARARLVYEPAAPGQPEVAGTQSWRFVAPLGPIEAEDLRWYLEQYAVWPSGIPVIQDRARRVEENLVQWGRLLYQAALPPAYTANVKEAWAGIAAHAGRRFSVHVDAALEAGAPDPPLAVAGPPGCGRSATEPPDPPLAVAGPSCCGRSATEPPGPEAGTPDPAVQTAKEAATLLLGLPWELLHDGGGYLFQGAQPVRVRRRLPNTQRRDVAAVAAPIRILLVTARPEDDACGYIDHRASALPLVEAMEALGGLVRLRVLSPPTLPALGAELKRAYDAREPYHVLHFDGHGVYDRTAGLGGLCFEDPRDAGKLEGRRHLTVLTTELGPLLKAHRIPLVFLEACQTAMAEEASESVASDLLQRGVASVVAMSHSVLVETARRFIEAFYDALAAGKRVGDAMLAGQRSLKDDTCRGRIFGAGELRLEDWFVPVLFQEKDDPQLFRNTPAPQTQADLKTILSSRLGALPPGPATGFIGRSRELLALQRLLLPSPVATGGGAGQLLPSPVATGEGPGVRAAVIRGQGGEGKTALAAEFARWLVRSQQMRRAAFVSVETLSTAAAVLDALGCQLVPAYSAAAFDTMEKALLPVERALAEQATLLVLDNMESILLPPYLETPELLSEDARRELDAILALCTRLNAVGETRLLFTSREALPAPFDAARQRRELHALAREDAVKLVERALNVAEDGGDAAAAADAAAAIAEREQIEALVDAVHGHARTLALLAPALRERGVDATRAALVELMAEMERRFPGSREHSVYASVELSLRRLSPANRDRARVLGVFQGVVDLDVLIWMTEWQEADVVALANELIATGLATPNPYGHLTLNPALCPYLRGGLDAAEREALMTSWRAAMAAYVEYLVQQQSQKIEIAAALTVLELPNLFALLEQVQAAGDAEATIGLTTSLYSLLQGLGRPRLLARVGQVRDAAAALAGALGETWNHARFEAQRSRIEQQLAGGRLRDAFDASQELLRRARAAGETAYPAADYDLAAACFLLARVLKHAGGSEQALPLLDEAQQRFEAVAKERASKAAERMASVCIAEQGACLSDLGRLDEAAAAYEESIRRAEKRVDDRDVAVGKFELGTVRLRQRRYPEALAAYAEARERFGQLGEPGAVGRAWHQTGMAYQEAGQPEAAEDAYRKALAIKVRLGDVAEQGSTLGQLGNLYDDNLNRPEEAIAFYRQAADKYVENRDQAKEGAVRNNLADTLRKLRRLDKARQEIRRAIECKAQFGHASLPWTSWNILAGIETDAGNATAAAEAQQQAIACYLAYRRDGGENHSGTGRLCFAVTQSLLAGKPGEAASLLQREAARYEAAGFGGFIRALQAIAAGSRDRALAAAPDLTYDMAAELLFLIETLEQRG